MPKYPMKTDRFSGLPTGCRVALLSGLVMGAILGRRELDLFVRHLASCVERRSQRQ